MGVLPKVSGAEVVRALSGDGWEVARKRGRHIIMVKEGHIASLSIPNHKDVAKGTLRSIIRISGLTVDEFLKLLSR